MIGQHGLHAKGNGYHIQRARGATPRQTGRTCSRKSIRIPLIVRWPGVTKPGLEIPQPVSNSTLSTVLSMLGAKAPANWKPGRGDLSPLLRGKTISRPTPRFTGNTICRTTPGFHADDSHRRVEAGAPLLSKARTSLPSARRIPAKHGTSSMISRAARTQAACRRNFSTGNAHRRSILRRLSQSNPERRIPLRKETKRNEEAGSWASQRQNFAPPFRTECFNPSLLCCLL